MRKETAVFTCDICGKVENYIPDGSLVDYDKVEGWYFNKKLVWNEHYSASLDFCKSCFESAFRYDRKHETVESKKCAASIWRKLFGKRGNT